MKHLEVVVLTKSTTTPRILNWKVSTVNNVETAIEKLQQRPYKVVAISNEIPKTDYMKLSRLVSVVFDTVILVEYTDKATLSEKVKMAYWSKNKPGGTRSVLDNSIEMKLAHTMSLN